MLRRLREFSVECIQHTLSLIRLSGGNQGKMEDGIIAAASLEAYLHSFSKNYGT